MKARFVYEAFEQKTKEEKQKQLHVPGWDELSKQLKHLSPCRWQ